MAQFRKVSITQKGLELAQKVQTGNEKMSFTKIATGSGQYTDQEEIGNATALRKQEQIFPISSYSLATSTSIRLTTVISNKDLDTAYYVQEIGIYANDPDEGEILYALTVASQDRADYLPAYDGVAPVTIGLDMYVAILNAENVTVEIGSGTGAYASAADLMRLSHKVDTERINIVIMEEDIPVEDREEHTFYLKVTDRQSIGVADNIRVSPNMGLRLV